jgi:methionyl-tRNA synthetase
MDEDINKSLNEYINDFNKNISKYNLKESLDLTFKFLDVLNKYVDEKQPWTLIKEDSKKNEVIDIFYTIAE